MGKRLELEIVDLDEKKYANVYPLVPQSFHPVSQAPRPARPTSEKRTTLACSCDTQSPSRTPRMC